LSDSQHQAQKKSTTLRQIRSGHRWLALPLSLFLIFMAITGIVLNHAESLGIGEASLPGSLASRYYSIPENVQGYALEDRWFYNLEDRVFLDGQRLLPVCTELTGVVKLAGDFVVACTDSLLLMDSYGALIEEVSLSSAVSALGTRDDQLVLKREEGAAGFDLADLAEQPLVDAAGVSWATSALVPAEVLQSGELLAISWQKFILDLHSGRYFGQLGVWFQDFIAILFMVMALTGLRIWWGSRR